MSKPEQDSVEELLEELKCDVASVTSGADWFYLDKQFRETKQALNQHYLNIMLGLIKGDRELSKTIRTILNRLDTGGYLGFGGVDQAETEILSELKQALTKKLGEK